MTLMRSGIKAAIAGVVLAALGQVAPTSAATFAMKRGVNLDQWVTWPASDTWSDPNVILPFPEWRKNVSPEDLAALKRAGFDFVRMPVPPAPLLVSETSGLREELFASVLDSVKMINDIGLKVVVDMHLIGNGGQPGGMEEITGSEAAFDGYLELVRQMAKTLNTQDPQKVAFELMNEPNVDCRTSAGEWGDRQKKLFAAARSSATRLTLVLTGACMSSADGLATVDPTGIPDDNILWTFHSYEPFVLTHQGASWAGDFIPYVTGLPYPPSSVPREELDAAVEKIRQRIRDEAPYARRSGLLSYLDEQVAEVDTESKLKAVMDRPFDTVAAWATRYNVAPQDIFLGEFGMITQDYGKPFVMPAAWRAAYAKDVISRAEARGFAWSIWGYGGSFGIVDAFDGNKADPDVLDAIKGLGTQ